MQVFHGATCAALAQNEILRGAGFMALIGNILWLIFGGLWLGLAWWFYAAICFVSIIGIPWGRACFVIGIYSFLPFGNEAISRKELYGQGDIGTGDLGMIGNIIWFILAGLWLALGHLFAAIVLFITIIGIPFGIAHLRLARLALAPIGQTIVSKAEAEAARSGHRFIDY